MKRRTALVLLLISLVTGALVVGIIPALAYSPGSVARIDVNPDSTNCPHPDAGEWMKPGDHGEAGMDEWMMSSEHGGWTDSSDHVQFHDQMHASSDMHGFTDMDTMMGRTSGR